MSKSLVAVAVLSALTFSTRLALAEDPAPEPKDRGTAIALSAGGTLASAALVLAGMETHNGALGAAGLISSVFTPSAGEIYAGRLTSPGLILRVASAGVGIAGALEAFKCFGMESGCTHDAGLGGGLLVVGGIGFASGVLYDIATAGHAVDDYNRRLPLRVTPAVIPTASSGPAVGLGIGGSF